MRVDYIYTYAVAIDDTLLTHTLINASSPPHWLPPSSNQKVIFS